MSKIDKVVLRETAYIAAWTLIFSAMLQAVFLIIGKWEITVLFGNLYSGVAVILNFFLMGLSVQKAMQKSEKDASQFIKASSSVRMLALFVIVLLGVLLDCFNIWAVVIPLFFPRLAIMLRPLLGKRLDSDIVTAKSDADAPADIDEAAEEAKETENETLDRREDGVSDQ